MGWGKEDQIDRQTLRLRQYGGRASETPPRRSTSRFGCARVYFKPVKVTHEGSSYEAEGPDWPALPGPSFSPLSLVGGLRPAAVETFLGVMTVSRSMQMDCGRQGPNYLWYVNSSNAIISHRHPPSVPVTWTGSLRRHVRVDVAG